MATSEGPRLIPGRRHHSHIDGAQDRRRAQMSHDPVNAVLVKRGRCAANIYDFVESRSELSGVQHRPARIGQLHRTKPNSGMPRYVDAHPPRHTSRAGRVTERSPSISTSATCPPGVRSQSRDRHRWAYLRRGPAESGRALLHYCRSLRQRLEAENTAAVSIGLRKVPPGTPNVSPIPLACRKLRASRSLGTRRALGRS